MILASIPLIIAVIAGVILFTNVDEVISESIKIDTSTFNFVTNTWPIDSECDWFVVWKLETYTPHESHTKWFKDNFSKEHTKMTDSLKTTTWGSEEYTRLGNEYYESILKKTNPELHGFTQSMMMFGEDYFNEITEKDPECNSILNEINPNLNSFR